MIETRTVRIVVDADKARADVRAFRAELAGIASSGSGAGAANDNVTNSFTRMADAIRGNTDASNKLGSAHSGMARNTSVANDNMKLLAGSTEHASSGLAGMFEHVGKATLAIAGLGFAIGGIHALLHTFTELSDESAEVTSRLLAFTNGSKELAAAQEMVVQVANKTRSGLPEIAELFQKIGIQADHLHLSLSQVGVATTVFAETLKLSGSTTNQSKAAMLQLGEAFDIGQLNGRHFIAMMMDNIVFMRLLASSMNVPIGKLKELSKEGKVTADQLTKALTDPKMVAQIEQRFGRLPVTFGQVRVGIKNSLTQLAGDFAEGAGINSSLAVLYANIAKLGTDLKPTFEKIGVAFRAAVDTFAPAVQAAMAAIGPLFSFVLDNAPAIIKVLKVGAEAWFAYAAGMMAVKAINLAGNLATELQFLGLVGKEVLTGASSFSELGKALKATTAGQAIFNAVAMLNPYVAIGAAIIGVVALLYEFRDAINIGGGTMASLGDLMSAVWLQIQTPIKAAWDVATKFFGWLGSEAGAVVNTVAGLFGGVFSGFDFSIAGAIRAIAQFGDFFIGTNLTAWGTLKTIWNNFPGFLQFVFATAANLAIGELEKLANSAKTVLNAIITGINAATGTKINLVPDVKLGRVDTGKFTEQLAANVKGSFGHALQDSAETLLKDADNLGKQRRAALVKAAPVDPTKAKTLEGEGGDDKKDKKAEARAKKEREYWQTLQDELVSAGLYGEKLAEFTKEKELHKILERDLTASEKARVDTAVQAITNEKAITDLKKSTFELTNQNTVATQRQVGLTTDQAKIQDAIDAKMVAALNEGVNIKSKDYQAELAIYKIALERNQAQDKLNALLKTGLETAKKYNTAFSMHDELQGMQHELDDFLKAYGTGNLVDSFGKPMTEVTKNAVVDGIKAAMALKPLEAVADFTGKGSQASQDLAIAKLNAGKSAADSAAQEIADPVAREQYLKDIAKNFTTKMDEASSEVADFAADALKKKFTDVAAVFNKVGSLIGGKAGDAFNAVGSATSSYGDFAKTSKDTSDAITGALGGSSDLVKGIGKAVGGAVAGLQIGESIGKLGTALGLKGSETGAKIGGAIGGLTGNPLIAAAASIVGGLISSLFYKPPSSSAGFTTDSQGNVVTGTVTGSNAQLRKATSGAAGEVITGLQSLASSLGGTLTGAPNLQIGTFDNKWRVNDSATSKSLNYNNFNDSTLHNFDDDEAAAVKYAIGKALEQGVITGLSDLAQKAIKALDSDSAVTLVQNWTAAMKDFAALTDPVTAAVQDITTPMKQLRDSMVAVGASSADLTKLDEYRAKKLDDLLKQETASIRDIIDNLNGDGGAVSVVNQFAAQMKLLSGFKSDISAGKSIDQDAFTAALNKAISLNGSINGTNTAAFQDNVNRFKDLANSELQNITNAFNSAASSTDPTVAAITTSNDAVTAQLTIANDYQAQQVDLLQTLVTLQTGASSTTTTASAVNSANGYQLNLA